MSAREVELFGLKAQVPEEWLDRSLYRFASPQTPDHDTGIRPNFVVASHEGVPEFIPLEEIFRGPNLAAEQQHKDFEVLRQGVAEYLGQSVAWQDTGYFDGHAQRKVFQRQIASRVDVEGLVVLTLTSGANDLEKHSAEFGFRTVSAEKRSRAAAAAAGLKKK